MDKLAEKLAELAEKYGPYTIEMARSAATVEAWKALISAIVFSMVFAYISYFMQRLARNLWATARSKGREMDDHAEFWGGLFCWIAFFFSSLLFLIAAADLIDPWTWVSLSNPDLLIAKRIIKF